MNRHQKHSFFKDIGVETSILFNFTQKCHFFRWAVTHKKHKTKNFCLLVEKVSSVSLGKVFSETNTSVMLIVELQIPKKKFSNFDLFMHFSLFLIVIYLKL